ncbi:MAG: ral secretion pathway protein [Massilia sp.]|jgi:general secretion pathway protein C
MKRLPLLFTLLALIFLAVSATYWGMQLYKPQQRPIAAVQTAALPEPSPDAAATLFGGQAVSNVASNYQLTGTVAAGRDSVAILVAEGQPPKALKVGRELAPGVSISEVHPKYVMLSEGGVMRRVDLVADTRPAIPLSGAAPMPSQMAQPAIAPGAVPATEPQTMPGVVQAPPPAPPPGEVNPVVPQGQEPPPEGPPADVQPTEPPPPNQPQMPPPTRAVGSPVGNQPVSQ